MEAAVECGQHQWRNPYSVFMSIVSIYSVKENAEGAS